MPFSCALQLECSTLRWQWCLFNRLHGDYKNILNMSWYLTKDTMLTIMLINGVIAVQLYTTNTSHLVGCKWCTFKTVLFSLVVSIMPIKLLSVNTCVQIHNLLLFVHWPNYFDLLKADILPEFIILYLTCFLSGTFCPFKFELKSYSLL